MHRGATIVATVATLLSVLAGAAAAATPAPQRYLDPVFESVTATLDRQFATVVDSGGHAEQLLVDLYEPTGDTETRRPVVVWVHGGSFLHGDRTQMAWWARQFARRGYVSATIEYRLEDEATFDQVRAINNATADARAAVRWLRQHAGEFRLDTNRISLGGISAGAVTTLHSAYSFIAPGGPHPGYSSTLAAAISIAGMSAARPDPGEAPAIMFHGTLDPLVPYSHGTGPPGSELDAVSTCRRIRAAGVPCNFNSYTAVGHNLDAFDAAIRDLTLRFLSCRVGATSPFTDTDGRPYENDASWAVRSGIMAAGRRFRGEVAPTRASAVSAIWSLFDQPAGSPPHRFPDVAVAAPYGAALDWARANGVVGGPPAAAFDPDGPTTRGRLAVMLWRAVGRPAGAPPAGFVDVGNGGLRDAANWAAANGLLVRPGTRFLPNDPVTRGQMATVFHDLSQRSDAWDPVVQTAPPSTVCFRVGDPPHDA